MIKLIINTNKVTTKKSYEAEYDKISAILNRAFTCVVDDILLISNEEYWLLIRNSLDIDTFEVFDNMSDLTTDLLQRGYNSTDIRIIKEENIEIDIYVELD